MTIETSPANNLFAGFSDDERQVIAVAVRRVEELEETRRITAGMAGEAKGIQSDLLARGVQDGDVLREAAEAVAATALVQHTLAGEVDNYRKLFGPDGKAASAVGQYVQLLRNAHAGDVNALNAVQSARRELYEARDASAQERGGALAPAPARYEVTRYDDRLQPHLVVATNSALEAHDAFYGQPDHQVLDTESNRLVGYQGWAPGSAATSWKAAPEFAALVESERLEHRGLRGATMTGAVANEIAAADVDQVQDRPALRRDVNAGRNEAEQQHVVDPRAPQLQQDLTTALPAAFGDRYVRVGNKIVDARDQQHVLLVDKGAKLQVPREFDAESVRAAVDVAETRQWPSMAVSGDARFRQAVWIEAAARGIAVRGYDPTTAEQAFAHKAAEKAGKLNQVTEDGLVKAFRESQSPAERRKAAIEHPELKKAFALEASFSKLAERIGSQGSREAFMARMRDNIAEDLSQGRALVDIQLRRPMMKGKEYGRDVERDHERGHGR